MSDFNREAFLAEMAAEVGGSAPQEAAKDEPQAEAAPETSDALEETAEAKTEGGEEPEEPKAKEPEPAKDDAPVDPKVAQRLEAIHRADKRAREQHQARLAELRAKEQEIAERARALDEFEALRGRARVDPVAAMRALGLTEDDFEHASRQLYYSSKAAASKPELREIAQRSQREREIEARYEEQSKRLAALEERLTRERQEVEAERHRGEYLGRVTGAIGEGAPLLKAWHAKAPEKVREGLWRAAEALARETGQIPDAADVVAALEQQRQQDLEELGLDLGAITKASKSKTPVAGERKAARTLGGDLTAQTAPRSATKSRDDEIADVRRALEEGRLD